MFPWTFWFYPVKQTLRSCLSSLQEVNVRYSKVFWRRTLSLELWKKPILMPVSQMCYMVHLVYHGVNTASGGAAVLQQWMSSCKKKKKLRMRTYKLNNPGETKVRVSCSQERGACWETLNHLIEAFDSGRWSTRPSGGLMDSLIIKRAYDSKQRASQLEGFTVLM